MFLSFLCQCMISRRGPRARLCLCIDEYLTRGHHECSLEPCQACPSSCAYLLEVIRLPSRFSTPSYFSSFSFTEGEYKLVGGKPQARNSISPPTRSCPIPSLSRDGCLFPDAKRRDRPSIPGKRIDASSFRSAMELRPIYPKKGQTRSSCARFSWRRQGRRAFIKRSTCASLIPQYSISKFPNLSSNHCRMKHDTWHI